MLPFQPKKKSFCGQFEYDVYVLQFLLIGGFMLLNTVKVIWQQGGLGAPVLVAWRKVADGRPDLVAAAAENVYLFIASPAGYNLGVAINVGEKVLSLATGLAFLTQDDNIALGFDDRVVIYGAGRSALSLLWETEREPGARFVDLALADIDGDGREEVVAASEGKEALYFYRLTGETAGEARLELLAIRVLPGPAEKVTVVKTTEGEVPYIVAAYRNGATSGLLTLSFTERGFVGGPFVEMLPAPVTSLTGGNLGRQPGGDFAWGGGDGVVRVMKINSQLATIITTDNLGSAIPALTAGKLPGDPQDTLIAGTPEGYLFGYQSPIERSAPDWAVWTGRPANSLDVSDEGMLGLGATDGFVQVWLLSPGKTIHIVRPGETLTSIAARYSITVAAIMEVNTIIEPGLIFPGRALLIP